MLLSVAPATWAQTSQIEWPAKFPSSEEREVLGLAKAMGIDDPAKVSLGVVLILGDRFLIVDSRVSVNGHERTWISARMFRDNWARTDPLPPELTKHRVGRWISLGDSERETRWRIQDGNWFIDITLDERIAYEDAATIVRAVRRRTLIDRLSEGGPESKRVLPKLDAKRVAAIEAVDLIPGIFKVTVGREQYDFYEVFVRIVEDRVEVVKVLTWEV